MNNSHSIITEAFRDHRQELIRYFVRHDQDFSTAEDLTQDVFVRLLEWNREIDPANVRNLLFKMAANILCDQIRRLYVRREYQNHIAESRLLNDTSFESTVIAADIFRLELRVVAGLSPQRRTAYMLSRFDGETAKTIAEKMGISRRTVENHLFRGKKVVRDALRNCC